MKTILLMTLLVILTSCQHTGPNGGKDYFQEDQCSPQIAAPVVDADGVAWINASKSTCRCRVYHIGKDFIGPFKNENGNVTVKNYPLNYCNLIKGYAPKNDTKLFDYLDWVRSEITLDEQDKEDEQKNK